MYCLYLADAAGGAAWLRTFQPYLGMGGMLGSHGAIVVSGTVLGVMVSRQRREGGSRRTLVASVLAYAAGLAAAGLLLHTLAPVHVAFRFSKEQATPPWCLVSSALAAVAWVVVYVAADVRGWRCPRVVDMAGENALVAYLLAPALLALASLSAPLFGGEDPSEWLREPLVLGVVSAAVFSWLVVRLCGWLRRVGVRVQL